MHTFGYDFYGAHIKFISCGYLRPMEIFDFSFGM